VKNLVDTATMWSAAVLVFPHAPRPGAKNVASGDIRWRSSRSESDLGTRTIAGVLGRRHGGRVRARHECTENYEGSKHVII
jgi:hypothetical protein